jgi:hypothetical protein
MSILEMVFGKKKVAPDVESLPFDMRPEVARLVQANLKTNEWLSGSLERGDLQQYEINMVKRIEGFYAQS